MVADEAGVVDYKDGSKTENTRVSYPIYHIDNYEPSSAGGHPKNIIFLTADAFGVLPPVAKLTKEQAIYYFLSGYTAKVAGTERVRPGWVLVRVRAFGMNHSEQILREFEIENDYIQKPIVPGIECVGEIADPSDSGLAAGQKVVALMGGMGRSFNGSYAEYHAFVAIPRSAS